LLVPGLTEPVNFPKARLQVNGDQIIADPVVAVLGMSVFMGRLEHRGERKQPWEFDVRANNLSLEQGSLWFDALGRRRPLPLLERLPGLSSLGARREVASNLFSSLNARGRFATPSLTYRALTLKDFRAKVEITGRIIRITGASFRAGGGRGQGNGQVDLTSAPARLTADVSLAGVTVQALASRLPAALHGARGTLSGNATLQTHGLTREEMSPNLQGQATVNLKNLSFGEFDPLEALARDNRWGTLEPARSPVGCPSAAASLAVRDRRVALKAASLDLAGAKLNVTGNYDFDGAVDLNVRADFRHIRRRWITRADDSTANARWGNLHLAGFLDRLVVAPQVEVSRAIP
jgi:hypothetical protein